MTIFTCPSLTGFDAVVLEHIIILCMVKWTKEFELLPLSLNICVYQLHGSGPKSLRYPDTNKIEH